MAVAVFVAETTPVGVGDRRDDIAARLRVRDAKFESGDLPGLPSLNAICMREHEGRSTPFSSNHTWISVMEE